MVIPYALVLLMGTKDIREAQSTVSHIENKKVGKPEITISMASSN